MIGAIRPSASACASFSTRSPIFSKLLLELLERRLVLLVDHLRDEVVERLPDRVELAVLVLPHRHGVWHLRSDREELRLALEDRERQPARILVDVDVVLVEHIGVAELHELELHLHVQPVVRQAVDVALLDVLARLRHRRGEPLRYGSQLFPHCGPRYATAAPRVSACSADVHSPWRTQNLA
jgi:hypothetical protein